MTLPNRRRRVTALLASVLGAALLLAGCASNNGATDAESTPSEPSTTAGYPVTLETMYGEITLHKKPERVVALGSSYIDLLLALDEQPIAFAGAVRAGDDLLAGHPWLDGLGLDLAGHDRTLFAEGYTPSLEVIASYEPDLILGEGADWAIDPEMYEQISRIAPTYAPHDYLDWEQKLHDVGVLTNNLEAATQAIASIDSEFEDTRERLSGLQGASFVVADPFEQEIALRTNRFLLEELGMIPDTELAAAKSISIENLNEISSDIVEVMAWRDPNTQSRLEGDPRFSELAAVQNGTLFFSDATMTTAVDAGPHSIAWWLSQVVPQLESSSLNDSDR